jgi:GT2 family glycosyltransferase
MNISIVIPTRGRYDLLCQAIDSVRRQDYSGKVEIIVVDDASDPPLPDLPEDIKLLKFERQIGACAARNLAAKVATGELLLCMDDDAELVNPSDLTKAADWFINHPKLAVVGFRQLTPQRENHYLQPAAAVTPVKTGSFHGYACMIRREAFLAVGGMNEEFGYYFEEPELSLKLCASGYEIYYDPDLAAIHYQDNRHRDWDKIRLRTTRNVLLSYLLHYPLWVLPLFFLKRIFFHVQSTEQSFLPLFSDLKWIIQELISRFDYIRITRKPLSWSAIRKFHALCNNAEPIIVTERLSEAKV